MGDDAVLRGLKKQLRDTLNRAEILQHYVIREKTEAESLRGRIKRRRDRIASKYTGCECYRIAPELRYADMCDACAKRTGFDRSRAFMFM